jgi:carbon monoxide dehydrogenase subunit G
MTQVSAFSSRKGNPDCTPEEVFGFVTDMRNFIRFVPGGSVDSLTVEKESCSFSIPALGDVFVKLSEKDPFEKVVYEGKALQDNEFKLRMDILKSDSGKAEIQIFLEAGLNPFLKIMASGPITRFLEKLIDEIEKFRGWRDVTM